MILAPGHKPAGSDYIRDNKVPPELSGRQIRGGKNRTPQQNRFCFLLLLLYHRHHACAVDLSNLEVAREFCNQHD